MFVLVKGFPPGVLLYEQKYALLAWSIHSSVLALATFMGPTYKSFCLWIKSDILDMLGSGDTAQTELSLNY